MKRKGHKHKESFSILFISNTGNTDRKFHISKLAFRLIITFFVTVCAAAVFMGWMVYRMYPWTGLENIRNEQDDESNALLVSELQEKVKNLDEEMLVLKEENEALKKTAEEIADNGEKEKEAAEEANADSAIPRRYPSSGISSVITSYSEEQPYLAINTHAEGNIIATGNGTVTVVTSDDTYPVIIEVEHEKGYKSRYMCHQEAEILATQGAWMEAGDTLFTITIDDTQLDYQITFEGNPIDPLTVIEAKG